MEINKSKVKVILKIIIIICNKIVKLSIHILKCKILILNLHYNSNKIKILKVVLI